MHELPSDIKRRIREFASDKLPPTPTCLLVKELDFKYYDTTDAGIYFPRRLEVRSKLNNTLMRRYWLHDFLPSYWSLYADTFDDVVYSDLEDVARRLRFDQ